MTATATTHRWVHLDETPCDASGVIQDDSGVCEHDRRVKLAEFPDDATVTEAVFVLLTDDDDRTRLVACRDKAEAEAVASKAVWGTDSVSAWLIPKRAVRAEDAIPFLKGSTGGIIEDPLDEMAELDKVKVRLFVQGEL